MSDHNWPSSIQQTMDQACKDHIAMRQEAINDALPPGVIMSQAAADQRIRALVCPNGWTTYTLDGVAFLHVGPIRLEHIAHPDRVTYKLVCDIKRPGLAV